MYLCILMIFSYAAISASKDLDNKIRTVSRASTMKLLPSLQDCGRQNTVTSLDNAAVALEEFPWMVHVKFSKLENEHEFGDRCSGVLISNRYVLTDAYCGYDTVIVKLGQYRTNDSISCVGSPDFRNCSDPTVEILVEEKSRDGKITNGPYDLVLLRLAEKVNFTDFIRPICLPAEDSKVPGKRDRLITSGWGASGPQAITKKKLSYELADGEVCYKEELHLEDNVKFANVSLICAVPQKTNVDQACSGDHGGPFMYGVKTNSTYQWFVEGIIVDASATGTPNSCSKDKPINGIRITPKAIQWIIDNIRE